ncbi:MAG: hypothetical protein RLZ75_2077 [Pseudomonadota bacterium]|jgi:hypothetical protein
MIDYNSREFSRLSDEGLISLEVIFIYLSAVNYRLPVILFSL